MTMTHERVSGPLDAATTWMTAAEVAAELGCHVETVYAMARAGHLPGARRHGTRSWRFHREELELYKRGQPAAAPDVAREAPDSQPPAPGGLDDRVAPGFPSLHGGVTAGDLERLGLLLLGYARLLQQQERRQGAER
jgi:excisionase family DNA binding protein